MTPGLPVLIAALLRCVVPVRDRAEVLAELAADYQRVRAERRAWAAGWWLGRESASLAMAFLKAAALAPLDRAPIWGRDVRLVVRGLRRAPLATLGAAATLAVGVLAGLLTVGLSRPLLFRPVSVMHGEAVRRVASVDAAGRAGFRLSYVELEEVRRQLDGAARLAAVNLQPVLLRTGGADLQTMVEVVDGGYFALVGASMVMGRPLVSADDRPGAPPVVVIGEGLWRRRFAADARVLGQTVDLNRTLFTVVGVSAVSASASAFGAAVDAWAPLAQGDALLSAGWRTDVNARWFSLLTLPERSVAEVEARLAAAATILGQRLPDLWRARTLRTEPGTVLTGRQRDGAVTLVWILGALSALILAVGAANVAGVLLARVAATSRQTAVHLSMGAGRGAIVRRVLLEGALLGALGGGLALAGYLWARRAMAEIALLPTLALRVELPLDLAVVAGLAIVSVLAGVLLATGPALWAVRGASSATLGAGDARAIGGRDASRVRRLLVSTQLSVSMALVVGAALFSRSLLALQHDDVGFAPGSLVAVDFDIEPAGLGGEAALTARTALALAAAAPEVVAAAMSNRAPIDSSTPLVEVRRERGAPVVGAVTMYLATARYFETVTVPLLHGRAFTESECDGDANVVIVNDSLARRLWPDEDALGRALIVGPDQREARVVGVARDSKYRSLAEAGQLHVYRPTPPGFHLTLLARSAGDPRETLLAVQQALDRAGPGVVGFFPRTLTDHLQIELLPTRTAAGAATGLGVTSLLLSLVGLYGLVAWFVERRRREIGVRLAIGGRPVDIVRLVVRQTLTAAAPGLLAGIGLAALLGIAARASLYGVGALDPRAFLTGLLALTVVLGTAALVPSWRASRVDPTVALRDS